MILRRFVQHVTDQNWFAVGLDLLVVITGIFLGMQVTDWNQDRSDRERERQYLLRLSDDFARNTELIQQSVQLYDTLLQRQAQVLLILKEDEASITEEELNFVAHNLLAWSFWRQVNLEMGTIEELISSGEMTLIEDEEVRKKLFAFRAKYETISSQLSFYRDWYLETKPQFLHVRMEIKVTPGEIELLEISTESSQGVVSAMENVDTEIVDLTALKSAESITGLTELFGSRSIMSTILKEQAQSSREAQEILSRIVRRPADD